MAFTAQVSLPIINRWCAGRCTGFRVQKSGAIVGYFKIFETDEDLSRLFGKTSKVDINALNGLRRACGLKDIVQAAAVELPDVGDDDMMGYNAIIDIYPSQDGKFLNAAKFQRHTDEQQTTASDTPGEEDPF